MWCRGRGDTGIGWYRLILWSLKSFQNFNADSEALPRREPQNRCFQASHRHRLFICLLRMLQVRTLISIRATAENGRDALKDSHEP